MEKRLGAWSVKEIRVLDESYPARPWVSNALEPELSLVSAPDEALR